MGSEGSKCQVYGNSLQYFPMAAPIHALQMKASDLCKIQVFLCHSPMQNNALWP
jgi:hypothetical protein